MWIGVAIFNINRFRNLDAQTGRWDYTKFPVCILIPNFAHLKKTNLKLFEKVVLGITRDYDRLGLCLGWEKEHE
jgi:hypothetical protein